MRNWWLAFFALAFCVSVNITTGTVLMLSGHYGLGLCLIVTTVILSNLAAKPMARLLPPKAG